MHKHDQMQCRYSCFQQ